MESPKSFAGYDKDGNVLCRVTATDANEYINPNEVKSAIEKVKSAAESGTNSITKAVKNIESDASEAVIVQGTKMTEAINQTCNAVKKIPGKIGETLEEMHTAAVEAHDRLQTEANEQAYNSAWIEGVVNVR